MLAIFEHGLSPFLEMGSIRNSLSTSSDVVVWTAYILPSPDPTMWEYTGFVVVVVVLLCATRNSFHQIS